MRFIELPLDRQETLLCGVCKGLIYGSDCESAFLEVEEDATEINEIYCKSCKAVKEFSKK